MLRLLYFLCVDPTHQILAKDRAAPACLANTTRETYGGFNDHKGMVMVSQINVSACLDLISDLRTGSLCECIHLEAPHWIFTFTMERLKRQF